jgi:hypothetical protein
MPAPLRKVAAVADYGRVSFAREELGRRERGQRANSITASM